MTIWFKCNHFIKKQKSHCNRFLHRNFLNIIKSGTRQRKHFSVRRRCLRIPHLFIDRVVFNRLSLSFRCSVCSDHLTNWYYEKDGKLYCQKHYWEKFGELCHGCSLLMTGPAMVSLLPLLTLLTLYSSYYYILHYHLNKHISSLNWWSSCIMGSVSNTFSKLKTNHTVIQDIFLFSLQLN